MSTHQERIAAEEECDCDDAVVPPELMEIHLALDPSDVDMTPEQFKEVFSVHND